MNLRGQPLHHANRRGGTQGTKFPACLNRDRCIVPLDCLIPLVGEELRCGLGEKNNTVDSRSPRSTLELADDGAPKSRPTAIRCHHDRAQQCRRPEPLQGAGGYDSRALGEDCEFRARLVQIRRWQARRLQKLADQDKVSLTSRAYFAHGTASQAALGAQQLGAQQGFSACCFSCADRTSSVPYTVLSPVVRNVSHWTPCGSSIQLFSLCA